MNDYFERRTILELMMSQMNWLRTIRINESTEGKSTFDIPLSPLANHFKNRNVIALRTLLFDNIIAFVIRFALFATLAFF